MKRAWLIALALVGCRMEEPSSDKPIAKDPSPPAAQPAAAAAAPREPIGPRGVKFIHAEPGEVASQVKKQLADASAHRRDLVVYEGATWCQPCQKFHAAAQSGQLDAQFPALTLLEFDADQDGERLLEAGYHSRYIPLFAVPGPDGKSTDKQIEGSVKGDAIADIAPRLKQLLNR